MTQIGNDEMVHIDTRSTTSGARHPEWFGIGAQIANLANKVSGRSDLVGLASPVAGSGAPACFKPQIAEVEVNTDVAFGKTVTPEMIGDFGTRASQYEFPVATGAVIHEAFHARFSRWDLENSYKMLKQDEYEALTLLEEARIEAQGLALDPAYRVFLRSSALEIVIADFEADAEKSNSDVQSISILVGLVNGRVIGGILDKSEVREVTDFIEDFLGPDVVDQLSDIIRSFIKHDQHHNIEPVHPLAIEWARIVRELKAERGEESGSEAGSGSGSGMSEMIKELIEKLGEASDGVSVGNYSDLADQQESEEWKEQVQERSKGAKQQREHESVASDVFGRGTGPSSTFRTSSSLQETRKPTAEERRSAVKVASALERAKYRERDIVEIHTNVPGGRLRTRALVQNEAMRARGLQPQTEAWRKRVRKTTDEPTLNVGVMVDISGSMMSAMKPMATTAWVMSEAVRRVQGRCAMVYYGNDVFPTLKAGQHLDEVTVYTAPDGTEKFNKAFKALDGALNLLNGNGARLLVVVSDGVYTYEEAQHAKRWIAECQSNGVAVVWIPFDNGRTAQDLLRGLSAEVLAGVVNPTETADAIGRACAKALTAMGSRNG
jgi:hypothetical protein